LAPYRAIYFTSPGEAQNVVTVRTAAQDLTSPAEGEVQLRMKLAPINPSDVNVLQGVYPAKPRARTDSHLGLSEPYFVPGNEGLGEVVEIGGGATASKSGLKVGDRVVMGVQQAGTWSSHMNIKEDGLIKVQPNVSDIQAATMSINPPTALMMLRHFVQLPPGAFVVQNGANSQAVIQIAKALGYRTINLVRDRPDIGSLKESLEALGADYVLTYDELNDKKTKDTVKEWTGGKPIRLALNCVSGKDTTSMLRLLGQDAHLVSYGAMSKQPLSIPTSYFIFKNLTAHGFMMSSWFAKNSMSSRREVMGEIMSLFERKLLKEPVHEYVSLSGSDEAMTGHLKDALAKIEAGSYGWKAVLRFD
ncbi:NAD(P)-binding protein, partial [Clavulina sp. PMI_390]